MRVKLAGVDELDAVGCRQADTVRRRQRGRARDVFGLAGITDAADLEIQRIADHATVRVDELRVVGVARGRAVAAAVCRGGPVRDGEGALLVIE